MVDLALIWTLLPALIFGTSSGIAKIASFKFWYCSVFGFSELYVCVVYHHVRRMNF